MKLSQRRVVSTRSLNRISSRSHRRPSTRRVRKTLQPSIAVSYLHCRWSFRRLPCYVPEYLGAARFVSWVGYC